MLNMSKIIDPFLRSNGKLLEAAQKCSFSSFQSREGALPDEIASGPFNFVSSCQKDGPGCNQPTTLKLSM
jgi:hypothetical protein